MLVQLFAVNLQKDKITGSEQRNVFRASLFKLVQQIYYTLEKGDCIPLQVSLILPIRSFLYIWSICYVGFKTY